MARSSQRSRGSRLRRLAPAKGNCPNRRSRLPQEAHRPFGLTVLQLRLLRRHRPPLDEKTRPCSSSSGSAWVWLRPSPTRGSTLTPQRQHRSRIVLDPGRRTVPTRRLQRLRNASLIGGLRAPRNSTASAVRRTLVNGRRFHIAHDGVGAGGRSRARDGIGEIQDQKRQRSILLKEDRYTVHKPLRCGNGNGAYSGASQGTLLEPKSGAPARRRISEITKGETMLRHPGLEERNRCGRSSDPLSQLQVLLARGNFEAHGLSTVGADTRPSPLGEGRAEGLFAHSPRCRAQAALQRMPAMPFAPGAPPGARPYLSTFTNAPVEHLFVNCVCS